MRRNGFTLVEILVALLLLGLVGLTLVRFQTFQIAGSGRLALAAGARLEADNKVVDFMAAAAPPASAEQGGTVNAGRTWYWSAIPGPSPDPAAMPDAVSIHIAIALTPGGPPLATRDIVRSRR